MRCQAAAVPTPITVSPKKRRSVYIKRGVPDSDISVNGTKTDLSPIRTVKRKFCFSLRNGSRQKTISGTAFRRAFFVLNAFFALHKRLAAFFRVGCYPMYCSAAKKFFGNRQRFFYARSFLFKNGRALFLFRKTGCDKRGGSERQ